MNLNKLLNSVLDRVVIEGKKKSAEATAIIIILLSNFIPENLARDIITGVGALWAVYKLYDKD
jgi:hypothetical protein